MKLNNQLCWIKRLHKWLRIINQDKTLLSNLNTVVAIIISTWHGSPWESCYLWCDGVFRRFSQFPQLAAICYFVSRMRTKSNFGESELDDTTETRWNCIRTRIMVTCTKVIHVSVHVMFIRHGWLVGSNQHLYHPHSRLWNRYLRHAQSRAHFQLLQRAWSSKSTNKSYDPSKCYKVTFGKFTVTVNSETVTII